MNNTVIDENWVTDIRHSDNNDFFPENEIYKNALESIKFIESKEDLTYFENKLHQNDEPPKSLIDHDLFKLICKIPNRRFKNYMSKTQNWVGHIIEISDEEFTAKLIDEKIKGTYEIAKFSIKEVSEGDLNLLQLGAVFYWSVGYLNREGQITKESIIRFKRTVEIPIDEFDSIIDNANELSESLEWI